MGGGNRGEAFLNTGVSQCVEHGKKSIYLRQISYRLVDSI